MSHLVFALLLLLPQPQNLLVDDLVNRVSQTYGKLRNFQAEIEQIQQFSSNRTDPLRGHVYLKSGRRARFDYESPRKMTEYFDGKTYTRFVPEIDQARQKPMGKADEEYLAILQIVGNPESPWKDQFGTKQLLRQAPLQPGDRVVRLIPNNKNLGEVLIEVDPRSFMIHRLVFTYAGGGSNEFRFKDIKTTPLEDELFKFKAPPRVTVIKE
jgi:outer membrane lipoprotein-sorting protein